ncbi:hypothetical protein [Streptomyces liangshanensis]|uniref:hypothetical protein n=1 Tax=Streptomyces liangshanensis TaxID=2717324 RepID=UPI0036DAA904
MVEHLPPGSATARAELGHHWSQDTYLLADLRDMAGDHFTAFLNANRAEKSPPLPYPERSWRPGDPTPEQKAKQDARDLAEARKGYQRLVAQVTPQHAETG